MQKAPFAVVEQAELEAAWLWSLLLLQSHISLYKMSFQMGLF